MLIIKDPYGFIYITTNTINGKRYIGQKKFDGASRWKSYLGSGHYLLKAFKKYGKENFVRSIVDIAYNADELNQKEISWIKNYSAVESDNFYNRMDGGITSDSLARKISIAVICIDTGHVFNSLAGASLWSGYSVDRIKRSFNKNQIKYNKKKESKWNYVFRPYVKINNNEKYCKMCGNIFKIRSNRHRTCDSCTIIKVNSKNTKTGSLRQSTDKDDRATIIKKSYYIKVDKIQKNADKAQEISRLLEMQKDMILDLYLDKNVLVSEILKKIKIKGISIDSVHNALISWGVDLKKYNNQRNKSEYIFYNAIYDSNNALVYISKYKHQTREWLRNKGYYITSSKLNFIIKNGIIFNGYKIIAIEEIDYIQYTKNIQ